MLFFAAVAAMAVAANAQTLRISNAVIGSTTAGQEQVIPLGAGPQVLSAHHAPVHHHKVAVVNKVVAAPVTYSVAQPIHHKIAYVAQPTVYKKVIAQPFVQHVAQPLIAAHHVAQPLTVATHHVAQPLTVATHHHVAQPSIVKVQNFEAPQIIKAVHHQPLKVQEEQYEIQPYTFSFDAEDEYQNKHGRQENKDANGVVTGQYTVAGADGISRIVSYIADHEGFRASIKTNEPGTLTSAPAGAHIESTANVPARR